MPPKKTVEKWIQEVEVRDMMARWRHIVAGHVPVKGVAPANKSLFTIGGEVIVGKLCATLQTAQNRILADAGNSSRALVIRDFAPEVIGKDGGADCTYCVLVIGASRERAGKSAVITAYPATEGWVGKKSPLS